MADDEKEPDDTSQDKNLVPFPQSRTRPKTSKEGYRELGNSIMAQQLGGIQPNLKGHWCSRCRGIWYGYVGEVECPVCGNRNG